jgi:hypothetical protein
MCAKVEIDLESRVESFYEVDWGCRIWKVHDSNNDEANKQHPERAWSLVRFCGHIFSFIKVAMCVQVT